MGLFIGSLLAGLLVGAYQSHQSKKLAEKQQKIQQEGIAHQMLAEAGRANPETKQNDILFNDASKKSALQGYLASRAGASNVTGRTKFGDA